MSDPQEISVNVRTGNGLGISALVLATLGLIVCWIPFLGIMAWPLAGLAILLGMLGLAMGLVRRSGVGMNASAVIIAVIAIVVSGWVTAKSGEVLSDAMDETHKTVQEGRDRAEEEADEAERIAKQEREDYIANSIVLSDVKAKYHNSVLNGRTPGVRFKLKNNGDRTLHEVEVLVLFKDASGAVISEEDYHPVLVNQFSLGDNKPLKPGYIWTQPKNQFYSAKSVPEEWDEGSVEAKITEIKFAPEED